MRYGLFTSAPVLLLALYSTSLVEKNVRLTTNLKPGLSWFLPAFFPIYGSQPVQPDAI
jgi:hypothetical protein